MPLSNDTRGWILTCISALACIIGASVICIDLVIRLFPGKKNFRIQDNNGFLSCSLSLSSGVMLFSALYRMLPASNESLQDGGFGPKAAAWVVIGCFLLGVFGIQVLSRIFHHFLPSHVVGCSHTHDEDDKASPNHESHGGHEHHDHNSHSHAHNNLSHNYYHGSRGPKFENTLDGSGNETTPLLPKTAAGDQPRREMVDRRSLSLIETTTPQSTLNPTRPSLQARMTTRVQKLVSGVKATCDENGPCFGYSNPCGNECFKKIQSKGGARGNSIPTNFFQSSRMDGAGADTVDALAHHTDQERQTLTQQKPALLSRSSSSDRSDGASSPTHSPPHAPLLPQQPDFQHAEASQHHHHVPQNAFLSIGLQTCFAIALHKIPEGFITFATNHASPQLGFTVFLALFIHNISEGFALALPLFLALNSRIRSLTYAMLLGGLSQPLGAAIAALWLHFAESKERGAQGSVSQGAYGGMFAATAGVLASVALTLLQQSLELSHNKTLCIFFVFIGMGIMGVSSALTA